MRQRLQTGGDVLGWSLFVLMLAGLPLLGIIVAGCDPAPYLEMPPVTRYVDHAGFSWAWFGFFAITDLLLIAGLLWAIRCGQQRKREAMKTPEFAWVSKNLTRTDGPRPVGRFPWWGWAGLFLCLAAWLMAWKRFAWFWLFQPHTFLPIWAGFILLINALSVKRSGSCLVLRRVRRCNS